MSSAATATDYRVGTVSDFEEGRFRIFDLGNRSIGVVCAGGTFYAVLNVCPHALAPVCEGSVTGTILPCATGEEPAFGLENRILRCPWHHFEFDLGAGGESVFTDFRARVRLFPVRVDDGNVFVTVKARAGAAVEPRAKGRRARDPQELVPADAEQR